MCSLPRECVLLLENTIAFLDLRVVCLVFWSLVSVSASTYSIIHIIISSYSFIHPSCMSLVFSSLEFSCLVFLFMFLPPAFLPHIVISSYSFIHPSCMSLEFSCLVFLLHSCLLYSRVFPCVLLVMQVLDLLCVFVLQGGGR